MLFFIVNPTYQSGSITCGTYPTPSAEAKMKADEDANQPVLMCPGESAKYVCDAGGINALKVRVMNVILLANDTLQLISGWSNNINIWNQMQR